eukprot:Skav235622  [mRNA]  locus=scaffold358:281481:285202:+ [translate_table: standard]
MGRGVVDTVLAAVFAMSIRRISQRVDPEVELEHFEVSELRQLSASLLRDRRKLLTQLQQRERSCTELLSENFELNAWQSKLLSALDRANINLEEFLKEDDRKVRMAEADKQLEAELRQMHQAVGDQQKRLDALLRENDELRQQLAAKAKDVAPRDELGVSQELPELSETPAAQPAPGNDSPGGPPDWATNGLPLHQSSGLPRGNPAISSPPRVNPWVTHPPTHQLSPGATSNPSSHPSLVIPGLNFHRCRAPASAALAPALLCGTLAQRHGGRVLATRAAHRAADAHGPAKERTSCGENRGER